MIQINLLPEEFRRAESTPLPRMITIFTGVAVVFSLLLYNGWLFFRQIPEAESKLSETKTTLASRKKSVEVSGYKNLLKTIENLGLRKTAISDIYRSRVQWAVKLDQLINLTPEYIGFQKLVLTKPDSIRGSRTEKHGGILTMDCLARGTGLTPYMNFVGTLKGPHSAPPPPTTRTVGTENKNALLALLAIATNSSDKKTTPTGNGFFNDFMKLDDRGWVVYEKKGFQPGLRFSLELMLKTREADKPKPKRSSRSRRSRSSRR